MVQLPFRWNAPYNLACGLVGMVALGGILLIGSSVSKMVVFD